MESKKDSGGIKRMASNPSPEAERNDAAISLFGRPLNLLNQMELEQLEESMEYKKGVALNILEEYNKKNKHKMEPIPTFKL